MKIVIIGPAWPYRGGIAAFNERIAREYQKRGDEVEIYTFTLQYPSFLFPGKTQYSPDKEPEDLTIYRKVNSINPFNWIKVGLSVMRKKPDLAIVKFWLPFMAPCLGTISRIIRKNKTTKIVSILDNIVPHEKRPGDKFFANYFVGSMDAFVAMSRSVYNDVELFDRKKPKALSPHPLYDNFGTKLSREEALAHLDLDENDRYLLFFGFIRDYKGLDLLLKALADKHFEDKRLKLIVAGEFYNNEEQYYDLEKQYGLKDKVIWATKFIPDSEVKYYFCAADMIVQPYKSATQSGVTQIAYHFEKPMLVTNVGGLSEIVPNGKVGYSVNPQVEDIANALVDFFQNKRYSCFEKNILEEKKKYSWQQMVATVDALIEK